MLTTAPGRFITSCIQDAQRRAPFTELTISDYREGPETFRVLLNMPARLERFTFGGLSLSGYHPLNLRAVWLCLLPHVLTLESVRIGSMSNLTPLTPLRGMLAGVDFASFGRLTDLSLSFWATGSDDAGGEEAAGGGLLAPRLAAFEWVFDGDDGRALYADHFGPQEADFLRRLARAAVARRVPLRRIAVVFTPAPVVPIRYNLVSGVGLEGPEACDSDAAEHLEYPWDRMDRLADELRPMGIELTYNTPSVTRERFEAAVEEYRNAVAAARAGGQQARAAGVPSTISAGGGLLVDYWDLGGKLEPEVVLLETERLQQLIVIIPWLTCIGQAARFNLPKHTADSKSNDTWRWRNSPLDPLIALPVIISHYILARDRAAVVECQWCSLPGPLVPPLRPSRTERTLVSL